MLAESKTKRRACDSDPTRVGGTWLGIRTKAWRAAKAINRAEAQDSEYRGSVTYSGAPAITQIDRKLPATAVAKGSKRVPNQLAGRQAMRMPAK